MGRTKEERQAQRQERKQKLEALISAAENVPEMSDSEMMQNYEKQFDKVWPLMKAALQFAASLRVTGNKADAALEEIVTIGDRMAAGDATAADKDQFEQKLSKIWGVARMGISAAMVLTNDKVDAVLEKVLGIGDWITDTDQS